MQFSTNLYSHLWQGWTIFQYNANAAILGYAIINIVDILTCQ